MTDGWPAALRGVTESVVATRGPEGRWNVAALGLHAPDDGEANGGRTDGSDAADDDPGDRERGSDEAGRDGDGAAAVTAVTWGDTRTRRNFAREGGGVVQFPTDPRDFVEAALSIVEREEPVLDSAAAWARIDVERVATGEEGGTRWRRWRLTPVEHGVREERVPTINRGFNAVIDATVAASRLDVPAYDTATLLDRLEYFASVVESCGGPAEREAFARVDGHAGWRDRR
ncbi:MAG: DUF447 domain-containing protein [Haloferacaceae archaeon]